MRYLALDREEIGFASLEIGGRKGARLSVCPCVRPLRAPPVCSSMGWLVIVLVVCILLAPSGASADAARNGGRARLAFGSREGWKRTDGQTGRQASQCLA